MSLIAHVVILGAGVLLYSFRSQAVPFFLPEEVPIVDLYDMSEIPEMPVPQAESVVQDSPEEPLLAFQEATPEMPEPTPIPTPTPMSTATPMPTPTPTPTIMPTPIPGAETVDWPTMEPRRTPTPTPGPQKAHPQPEETVVALDVPRRQSVIESQADQDEVRAALRPEQSQRSSKRHSMNFSDRLSRETPLMFETENEFPYPEYLAHIKEKIEGLWFPEGRGTVSIFLVIDRNGKILQSGVDKGTGFDVNKLRESVVRAIALIKRFHSLPEGYKGTVLRVRITVRR